MGTGAKEKQNCNQAKFLPTLFWFLIWQDYFRQRSKFIIFNASVYVGSLMFVVSCDSNCLAD